MGSWLFKQFIRKAVLSKQPGPPPRPGLKWKPQTHRWIRDEATVEGAWENFYEDEGEYGEGWQTSQKVQQGDQDKIRNYKESVPAFEGRDEVEAEVREYAEDILPAVNEMIESGDEIIGFGPAKRIIESNFPEGMIQQFAEEHNESPERVSAVVNDIVTRIAHQEIAYPNYESMPRSADPDASVSSPTAPKKLVRGDHYSNFLHD